MKAGRDDRLEGRLHDLPGRRLVELTVDADGGPEGVDGIAGECPSVGVHEQVVGGQADRIGALDDRHRGHGEVVDDAMGSVLVEEVVEGRGLALQADRVGDRAGAMGGLTIDRAALMGVLAIGQVGELLHDQRQVLAGSGGR